jgi:hypothetical protein
MKQKGRFYNGAPRDGIAVFSIFGQPCHIGYDFGVQIRFAL